MKIKIITEHGKIDAEIDDSKNSKNPRTVKAIIEALPIISRANRWGDEIYFEIPVKLAEENAQLDMEIGDIAYWPPGHALCIFFGRTPVSTSDKPRIYSPGNVIGHIKNITNKNIEILRKVKDGEKIRIEAWKA